RFITNGVGDHGLAVNYFIGNFSEVVIVWLKLTLAVEHGYLRGVVLPHAVGVQRTVCLERVLLLRNLCDRQGQLTALGQGFTVLFVVGTVEGDLELFAWCGCTVSAGVGT